MEFKIEETRGIFMESPEQIVKETVEFVITGTGFIFTRISALERLVQVVALVSASAK